MSSFLLKKSQSDELVDFHGPSPKLKYGFEEKYLLNLAFYFGKMGRRKPISCIRQCVQWDAIAHCRTLCHTKDKRRTKKVEINLGNNFEGLCCIVNF